MEINKKRIEELNAERLTFGNAFSNYQEAMTVEQFEEINKSGVMWNLNLMAGYFWFYDLARLPEDEYDMNHVLSYYYKNNVDKFEVEVHLQGNILNAIEVLNNELVEKAKGNKNFIITKEDIRPFMHHLRDHQKVSASVIGVNRWVITTHIDVEELENIMGQCDEIRRYCAGEIKLSDIRVSGSLPEGVNAPVDGNKIMEFAWKCTEFGLFEEAKYIFETCKVVLDKSTEVLSAVDYDDYEETFVDNELYVLSTFERAQDYKRVKLSTYIGLGKVSKALGEMEEAKVYYNEILDLYSVDPDKPYHPHTSMHYWVGINRVIESALELYLIEDEDKKPALYKTISDMIIKMRIDDKANNFGESVAEPLLVLYMAMLVLFPETPEESIEE